MRIKLPNRFSRIVRIVAVILLLVIGAYILNSQRSEFDGAIVMVKDAKGSAIILAIIAEMLSVLTFGLFTYILLQVDLPKVGWLRPVGISLASTTLNNSLPGGAAISSVYTYREYRDLGAGPAFATWTVLAINIISGVALAAMAILGVAVSFRVSQGLDLIVVIFSLTLALVILSVAISNAKIVGGLASSLMRMSFKLLSKPSGGRVEIDRIAAELTAATPGVRSMLLALLFALLNWVFDALVLVLAYEAIGKPIPWSGLLLAYGAGQLAANLPITPGGLGVVEGSLSIALVAYGGAQESAVAAVLIYRLVSYWLTMPFGWAVYVVTVILRRKRNGKASQAGVAVVEGFANEKA